MENDKIAVANKYYMDAMRDAFLGENGQDYVKASRELLNYTNRRLDELTTLKLEDKDEQIGLLKRRFSVAEKSATDEKASQETKLYFYNEMKSINAEIDVLCNEKERIIDTREAEIKHDRKVAMFGAYAVPALTSGLKFAITVMQAIASASAGKKA